MRRERREERREEWVRVQGQGLGGTAVVRAAVVGGQWREGRIGRFSRNCSPAMESAAGLASLECS